MFSTLATFLAVSCLSLTASGWYMNEGVTCAAPDIKFGSYDPIPYFTWTHNIGTKITFACDEGYVLNGTDHAYCRMSGKWTELPECIPAEVQKTVCELPENFDSSIYIEPRKSNYKVGEIVTFDCTGYKKIDGHGVSRCGENGRFDPLPPTCVAPQCDPPQAPEHGMISPVRERYVVGDVVEYECEEGFDLIGDLHSTCEEDGFFTQSSTLCSSKDAERTCKLPGSQPGVIYDRPRAEYMLGETLSFSCQVGYKLVGDGKLVCLPSSDWSKVARCQRPRRTTCIRPASPINGRLLYENKIFYKIGQKVKFICSRGYEIDGEASELVCGNDGFFYPPPPKCQKTPGGVVAPGSCRGRCRSMNSRMLCQCDLYCLMRGDCCSDFESQCFR